MCKSFAEVAMDVIREYWEIRKEQNNPTFNQERVARLMGISRSQLAKALGEPKNPTISFNMFHIIVRWKNLICL